MRDPAIDTLRLRHEVEDLVITGLWIVTGASFWVAFFWAIG